MIIGFGMRWVASPIRTPMPPQKMTTFMRARAQLPRAQTFAVRRCPGSMTVARGMGTISFAPHSAT